MSDGGGSQTKAGRRRGGGSGATTPTPGASKKARKRFHITWELIACGIGGHFLVGKGAATVTPADAMVARVAGDVRWHRCLRCDCWMMVPPPTHPSHAHVPTRDEIALPLRGRPLRDRYVLRLISIERALHVLVLGLLAAAVFLFADHQRHLHNEWTRVLADLQQDVGGPVARNGIVSDLNKLFSLSTGTLYLLASGLVVYCLVLLAETIGLWREKRWAEYLTFVEACVLLPYELYELSKGVSVLKALTLAVNLAILLYLALAHRLFSLRGGVEAVRARKEESSGWGAVERATPPPAAAVPTAPAATTGEPAGRGPF